MGVGNSLYNLMKLSEVEVDPKTNRPADVENVPKIFRTEVPNNPFDDIDIRPEVFLKNQQKLADEVQKTQKKAEPVKEKIVANNKRAMITVGDDSDSEEDDQGAKKPVPVKKKI